MKRIKLTVAYDGTNYSGWQIQPTSPTIEKALDHAIFQVTGETLHVTGASRTDAGVHALGNVAVFNTNANIPGDRWTYALNRYLPEDIVIQESRQVSRDFHPRHCNTMKTYQYRILNTPFAIPQMRHFAWHVPTPLCIEAMNEAAQVLVGTHDFKSFCCVRTQVETTVRTIYALHVEPEPENPGVITMTITGNGFLYNMVRIIAGTLVQAGRKKITKSDIQNMLDEQNRCVAGQTAPPQGLTLKEIVYIDHDDAVTDVDFEPEIEPEVNFKISSENDLEDGLESASKSDL